MTLGMRPIPAFLRCSVLSLVTLACASPSDTLGAPCTAVGPAVGLPVAMADTIALTYQCRGIAQSFVATDSLLGVVTVWDAPRNETSYQPRTLYIVGTWPTGEPDGLHLIAGPWSVVVPYADPVNPIPFEFHLDPPVPLVVGAHYAIALVAGDANSWTVAACRGDCYPDGEACDLRVLFNCKPAGLRTCEPDHDLCFAMQYCVESETPALRRRWGDLKQLYR